MCMRNGLWEGLGWNLFALTCVYPITCFWMRLMLRCDASSTSKNWQCGYTWFWNWNNVPKVDWNVPLTQNERAKSSHGHVFLNERLTSHPILPQKKKIHWGRNSFFWKRHMKYVPQTGKNSSFWKCEICVSCCAFFPFLLLLFLFFLEWDWRQRSSHVMWHHPPQNIDPEHTIPHYCYT